MQRRLPAVALMAWLTCPAQPAGAQPPRSTRPEVATRRPVADSPISLMERRSGDRVLLVGYPWKVHRRPSVEVRLVTDKDADASKLRPLFFAHEYFEGEVRVSVYQCEDEAASVPVRKSVTLEEVAFEILGRRNSLGRPSACVVHRFPTDDPAPGAAAVFCLLRPWALDTRLLQLDLPREYFAGRGKMHVWFLRGGRILWHQTLDWPGHERREMDKAE